MIGERTLTLLGARAIAVTREVGGIALMTGQVLRALLPPRLDGRELVRNLHRMGNRSLPIVALTAFFAGGLMVVQSAPFVKRLGATSLAGWAAGYAVLRELGPILIALMFSGRVGANNTAELGTMTVTEQLDGLRSPGATGSGWGYNFDWQSRAFFVPEGTPSIVCTTFVAHAYLDAYHAFGEEKWLSRAREACEFILADLHRTPGPDSSFCFAYTPVDKSRVHNASTVSYTHLTLPTSDLV